MPADLSFIAHSPETDSDKFAPERVGDRLAKAGLADSGWTEKTQDRAMPLWIEFAHGQIFDEPLLYFFEIIVIAIENLLGLIEVEIVLAQFRPRQIRDNLDVTDDDGEFRTRRGNKVEPLQFAVGLRHDLGGRFRLLEAFAQLLYLLFAATLSFAQLMLDRSDLRTQVSAALRIRELRRHILLQLLLDLRDLELRGNLLLDRVDPLFNVDFLKERLFLGNIDIQIWREEIGELFGVVDDSVPSGAPVPVLPALVRKVSTPSRASF